MINGINNREKAKEKEKMGNEGQRDSVCQGAVRIGCSTRESHLGDDDDNKTIKCSILTDKSTIPQ